MVEDARSADGDGVGDPQAVYVLLRSMECGNVWHPNAAELCDEVTIAEVRAAAALATECGRPFGSPHRGGFIVKVLRNGIAKREAQRPRPPHGAYAELAERFRQQIRVALRNDLPTGTIVEVSPQATRITFTTVRLYNFFRLRGRELLSAAATAVGAGPVTLAHAEVRP